MVKPIVAPEIQGMQRDPNPNFHEPIPFHTFHQLAIARGDAYEHATMRTLQLNALLALTVGDAGECFRRYNTEIQDNVL